MVWSSHCSSLTGKVASYYNITCCTIALTLPAGDDGINVQLRPSRVIYNWKYIFPFSLPCPRVWLRIIPKNGRRVKKMVPVLPTVDPSKQNAPYSQALMSWTQGGKFTTVEGSSSTTESAPNTMKEIRTALTLFNRVYFSIFATIYSNPDLSSLRIIITFKPPDTCVCTLGRHFFW